MKALFISLSTYDIVGGIQTYNKKFIRALGCNDIEYKIISLHDKGNRKDGVVGCNSNILKFIFYILINVRYADINVWAHINLSSIFMMMKTLLKGKSLLITHGVEVWYDDLTKVKKKSLKLYDKILSVSNYTKRKLISVQGIEESRIEILANSIDLSNKNGFDSPFSPEKFNLLTVLRIDASEKLKSIFNILEALVILDDSRIVFTIIGKGNQLDFVKSKVSEMGLEDQVNILGYVNDLRPYFEHCDLFTLISDKEGFGIVYLEAMEYKKPCLAAKHCGSSDVVVDNFNGYSIAIDDIDSLVDRVTKLRFDTAKREIFGINGNQLLHDKFTFESFIKVQISHLKRICE
ncbi:glycosyltransferase family 4 protein [Vibrio caribbeanicus]|uniref:glycosyltransferase family 4 protein n=1 Tax=Vibrio caribbeanicus TaxID=701175 RepID=UPI0030DB8B7C